RIRRPLRPPRPGVGMACGRRRGRRRQRGRGRMSARILPDPHQIAAADPRRSVFVTANAGSGKTSTLVDRVARLLLEEVQPGEILCVTYTKAAAAEMQARLFDRLGAWAVMDDAELAASLADLDH